MMSRISVVVPVHNGERFIGEALRSIFQQTRPPDEVVVVDDGSVDRTAEIVRSFPVTHYLYQSKSGQASALNVGIRSAGGDLLAFLDADDRWLPRKLEHQVEVLCRLPSLEVVFGLARQFVEPGLQFNGGRASVLPARLPSAMLLRRCAFERIGSFSQQWTIGCAIEWCARADDLGLASCLMNEVVYERRIHGNNLTLTYPATAREYTRLIKCVLDSRRQARNAFPPVRRG